ncbi:DUF6011 domain-containing protein [Cohnella sp. GbtcB17]|uniref:DUF6011 domain-containing protein n=1 Tax=Cohnella sp. GbtcB17 TaxID=2824762 RepID=UPI0034D4A8F3
MEGATNCLRCNRPLKSEKSRKVGYGPVCAARATAEREEAEKLEAAETKPAK